MPMIRFCFRSRSRKALATLGLLVGMVLAQHASASCSISQPGFVAQDIMMDMGKVVIQPSLPVGAVIKELVVPINGVTNIYYCDRRGGGSVMGRFVNGAQQTLVPGFSNVYATRVTGVGIRVYRASVDGLFNSYYPHTVTRGAHSVGDLGGGSFRVELIKTAAQTGSGVIALNGRFTTYYMDGDGPSRPVLTSTFRGEGTTVVSPTCEVQAGSRNIPVEFGSVPNTSFTGVGSKAANRDFDIRLNCQGSNLAQFQSSIGIRLDASQDGSNMPGVLRLSTTANRATRIGIQIVRREGSSEREVRFGQTINIGTTTIASAALTLPLRARYVQTAAGPVGAGTASGQATFTIQYD